LTGLPLLPPAPPPAANVPSVGRPPGPLAPEGALKLARGSAPPPEGEEDRCGMVSGLGCSRPVAALTPESVVLPAFWRA